MRGKRVVRTIGLGLLMAIPASGAQAASVACKPNSVHAVCKANYASHPKGSLKAGQSSSGTATVNGKTVKWTCLGGVASDPPTPRQCTY